MPYGINMFGGGGAAALKTALDAWFAANTTLFIRGFSFLARDQIRATGIEFGVGVCWETGGNQMTDPFVSEIYSAPNIDALEDLLQAKVALLPAELYRGPFIDFLHQSRRTEPYQALILHTPDTANGAVNWP